MNTYEKQATDFLESTQTSIQADFIENGYHFDNDDTTRDIYKVTIKRGQRQFSLRFGQSIADSSKLVDKRTNEQFTLNGKGIYPTSKNILDLNKYRSAVKLTEVKGTPPTAYDVLACLQKYEVGTFEDFCGEFGYDTDSKRSEKIYKAGVKEYDNVCKIWSDAEIEQLQEIN